jgi:hypothetical protein
MGEHGVDVAEVDHRRPILVVAVQGRDRFGRSRSAASSSVSKPASRT